MSLNSEARELLDLEISTLGISWLAHLHSELTKPYFLNLKRFLKSREEARAVIFPPEKEIYSWSRFSSFSNVKVVILGQDPYHNVGQAHGLAFSVRPPTPPPPSLMNIYKELKMCYPETFVQPKHGSLLKWSSQGVLLLNACLTVEAHQPNCHAKKGWEEFTEAVIRIILENNSHVVLMAWGTPAARRIEKIQPGKQHLVLRSVHPSPLSASRGWFGSAHFPKANTWLKDHGIDEVDWNLLPPLKAAAKSIAPLESETPIIPTRSSAKDSVVAASSRIQDSQALQDAKIASLTDEKDAANGPKMHPHPIESTTNC